MSWTNSYQPPPPVEALSDSELYGPEPFDVNFIWPLHPELLETDRVKLVPFVPRLHAGNFWSQVEATPDVFRYYASTWPTLQSFLEHHEHFFRRTPENVLFAVIDKTRPDAGDYALGGSLAGTMALRGSSAANLSTEIAFVVVFPPFQRSHVASNAVGILLRYCLDLPRAGRPALGLRRVEWCAHVKNEASVRLAERIGFRCEGLTRWRNVMPEVRMQDGERPRAGDPKPEKPGRHTVILSVCWGDWEGGIDAHVQRAMDRRV